MTRVPPIVRDAFNVAMKDGIFEKMVLEQGWLENSDFLDYPYLSEGFRKQMLDLLETFKTPEERWHMLRSVFDEGYRRNLTSNDGLQDVVSR